MDLGDTSKKSHSDSGVGIVLERITAWVLILFYVFLAVLSLLLTSYLPHNNYNIEFSWKSWPLVLLSSVGIFAVLFFIKKVGALAKMREKPLGLIVAIYTFIASLWWGAFANVWPEWDPAYILKGAAYLNHPTFKLVCGGGGDETAWILCPGGYLDRFPYQIPFFLFVKGLNKIFGSYTYQAFEVLNALAAAITVVLIAVLAKKLFGDREVTNLSLLLCAAFLPLVFYVTFAYANTLSLPFVFLGIIWQVVGIQNNDWRYAPAALLSVSIGMLLKSTMIYVLMAMVVVWLLCSIKKKQWRYIGYVFLAVVFYFGSSLVTTASAHALGYNSKNGLPKVVWLAMGTKKPHDMKTNNFGWYNGLPTSWAPEDYDIKRIDRQAESMLQENVKEFQKDPHYTFIFFSKKFASEWTEPTYESLLASSWSGTGPGRAEMSTRPMNPILRSIYYRKGRAFIENWCDILQFLLVLGAALCLIRQRKSLGIERMTAIIIPFGMALLYLLWEAQAQYIMPAYLLMIPYSAFGINSVLSIRGRGKRDANKEESTSTGDSESLSYDSRVESR